MNDKIKFYNSNAFYVYEHIRLDTNEVFYVGKGKHDRALSEKNRNKHWHNIVNRCGFDYRIIVQNVDEATAFSIEKQIIKKYKELNCILANYTNGGEGVSGYKHTDESKQKMSSKAIGRIAPNKGMQASELTKQKMSLAKIGKPAWNNGIPHSEETKAKMSLAKIGVFQKYKWWNNGERNTRAIECPGENWVLGRIKR